MGTRCVRVVDRGVSLVGVSQAEARVNPGRTPSAAIVLASVCHIQRAVEGTAASAQSTWTEI